MCCRMELEGFLKPLNQTQLNNFWNYNDFVLKDNRLSFNVFIPLGRCRA